MVRRHKAARWEAFIAPYRAVADKHSDDFDEWGAWLVVSNPHHARLLRVAGMRATRRWRRHRHDRFYPAGWGWLRRAYGRKQRRNR